LAIKLYRCKRKKWLQITALAVGVRVMQATVFRCLLRGEPVSCPFRAGAYHAFNAWFWFRI